jgi:hypothetical protein
MVFYAPDGGTPTGAAIQDGTQPGGEPKADGKTFSQADLDRLVGERIGKERAKTAKLVEQAAADAVNAWRAENGLDDEALELWKKRDEAAASTRAQKAELTRSKNEAEALRKKHEATAAKLDSTLRSEAILRAATGKSHAPQDVVMHLLPRVKMLEDFSVVVVDEKGEPTSKDIETAVKELLEQKPYLAVAAGNFNGAGSRGTESIPSADGKEFWRSSSGRAAHIAKAAGG